MKFAVRQLLRTPSFTAVAVMTLALGITATSTIFAIVDELTFRPGRDTNTRDVYFVGVEEARVRRYGNGLQLLDFNTLAADLPDGVAAIALVGQAWGLIQRPGHAAMVGGSRVTAGYADVYRVRAQAGRWINHADNAGVEGADVVVISDRIWRDWFNRDPGVVSGGALTLREHEVDDRGKVIVRLKPKRIIGVAPAGFGRGGDIWLPYGTSRQLTASELAKLKDPIQPGRGAIVRLDEQTLPASAAERMTAAIGSRVATTDSPIGRVRLERITSADRLASMGMMILGFATLVFLGACANLGNMLYARAMEREGELAIRMSLGGTRFDVFRLLFAETMLLCGAAAAAGIAMTMGALRLFTAAFPSMQVDSWRSVALELQPNWRVFLFAAWAGIVAAALVGIASLWRSNRVSLQTRLASSSAAVVAKTEGRTLRTLLVSVQITAAVLLLIAAGIYLENTGRRLDQRLHFSTASLVAAQIELPPDYDESRGPYALARMLEQVRALDGVLAAAVTSAMPGGSDPSPRGGPSALIAEEPPRGLSGVPVRLNGNWVYSSPGLPETMGLPLKRGRDFLPTDDAGSSPVVIVSESAASGLWPGEDAIGKRLVCCGQRYKRTVIGIAPDPVSSSDSSARTGPGTFAYFPAAQEYNRATLILVRTDSPDSLVEPLRQLIVAFDPTIAVFSVASVNRTQFARASSERAARVLAGSLGALALGISLLGVYAVVSYFVTKRSREFGLRLALGATRGQVVKLVVDHSIHMILIGLLPGVLLASWGTRVFQAELSQLKPNGLDVWIAVPLIMLAAGIIAAYIPARRAARMDPNKALKEN